MAMAAVPELARVRARRRHKIWSHKRKATTTARRADKAWSCVAMKKLPREPDHSRVQRVRRTLDRERIHTCERIRRLREEQQQDDAPSPRDEFDEARSLAEIETHAGLIERAELHLKAIDAALSRLEGNRYGRCEGCGEELPFERLQAVPLATYCVGCQAQRNTMVRPGEGSIDEASSKLWVKPAEMDESLEAQDALVEPEEQLFVHDQKPFGTEIGEFEQLPPVATARRRGRVKKRGHRQ
jgi:DnaK suppressor protein